MIMCLAFVTLVLSFLGRESKLAFFIVSYKYCSRKYPLLAWLASQEEDRLCTILVFSLFCFLTLVNGTAFINDKVRLRYMPKPSRYMPKWLLERPVAWPFRLHLGLLLGPVLGSNYSPHSGACMHGGPDPDPQFLSLEQLCL